MTDEIRREADVDRLSAGARLLRWQRNSRLLDVLFYLGRDGATRTPSWEQRRRDALLANGEFPALLLVGKSERALTIEGALAPLLPKPKRNWLSVVATHAEGKLRLVSVDPTLPMDEIYNIERATLGGRSTPLNGPTIRIAVARAGGPDLILAVGSYQAHHIVELLNRTN